MKLYKKSEWFELDRPIAEPDVKWRPLRWENQQQVPNTYLIERLETSDGKVIWFGQATNWKRENGEWVVLSTDETIKPIGGSEGCYIYPENRQYWKKCEPPIYEELYLKLN